MVEHRPAGHLLESVRSYRGHARSREERQGVRPICQATKLLDRDPVVRRMAEQDILVMGRAAKDYLEEQRAQASPELKKAIDDLEYFSILPTSPP